MLSANGGDLEVRGGVRKYVPLYTGLKQTGDNGITSTPGYRSPNGKPSMVIMVAYFGHISGVPRLLLPHVHY